jgi:hypothetical protein
LYRAHQVLDIGIVQFGVDPHRGADRLRGLVADHRLQREYTPRAAARYISDARQMRVQQQQLRHLPGSMWWR